MLKKILLSFLALLVLSLSFAPTAHAQLSEGKWYNQSFGEWMAKVNDSPENEIFGERYSAAQVQWVIYGLFYFVINSATNGNASALSCLMTSTDLDACRDAIENLRNSFPGTSSETGGDISGNQLLKTISASPISLSAYLKDVGGRLHLIPKVEAQGFGFGAANPALTLWKISRNLAYAFLIIVITVMAFMIMFRVKISPQTVISVQSALPKIVAALILITFSYAIAGLLVDLMYVAIGLLSAFLVNGSSPSISSFTWSQMFNSLTVGRNVFDLFMAYWFQFFAAAFINIFSAAGLVSFFVLIFTILAFFLLLWYSAKVIILLLKTYIQIMLLIIVGPILILLGTISQGVGFGSWLRSMAANLAVYPLVGLMFTLALLFVRAGLPDWWPAWLTPLDINTGFFQGPPWDPPLTFGTGGASSSHLLWVLVSYGIIVLIPKVSDIVQGFISGKPFPLGTAIGESLGGPVKPVAGYGAGYFAEKATVSTSGKGGVYKAISTTLERLARGGR